MTKACPFSLVNTLLHTCPLYRKTYFFLAVSTLRMLGFAVMHHNS
jgi:hypothetical protein